MRFELMISCLLDRRFNQLSHKAWRYCSYCKCGNSFIRDCVLGQFKRHCVLEHDLTRKHRWVLKSPCTCIVPGTCWHAHIVFPGRIEELLNSTLEYTCKHFPQFLSILQRSNWSLQSFQLGAGRVEVWVGRNERTADRPLTTVDPRQSSHTQMQ